MYEVCCLPSVYQNTPLLDKDISFSFTPIKTMVTTFFMGAKRLASSGSLDSNGDFISNLSPSISSSFVNVTPSVENKSFIDCTTYDLMKISNLCKIDLMSGFDFDWNGNGGKPFSSNSIAIFKKLVENLSKQPEIAPTGRSSLLMQYDLDDGSILAFEVKETTVEMVCMAVKGDLPATTEVYFDNFIDRINEKVKDFYGQK